MNRFFVGPSSDLSTTFYENCEGRFCIIWQRNICYHNLVEVMIINLQFLAKQQTKLHFKIGKKQ